MPEPEEPAETTRSSALEVALGLALAGAVCGFVALSQTAPAKVAQQDGSVASAGMGSGGHAGSGGFGQGGAAPSTADSIEVALLLRQRTSANLSSDELGSP